MGDVRASTRRARRRPGMRFAIVVRPVQRPHHRRRCSTARDAALARARRADDDVTVRVGAGRVRAPAGRASARRRRARSTRSICLGAVIRGDTAALRVRGGRVRGRASQRVALDTGVPVVFGVLTIDDLDQALDRVGGCRGATRARRRRPTAIEMVAPAAVSCPTGAEPTAERPPSMLRLVLPKGSLETATLAAVRGRRPRGQPRLRRRLPRRRSTTRASSRCASCGRRRSRATSPTGCSTSASPGRDWIEETRADVVTLDRAALLEGDRPARSAWCSRSPATRRSSRSRTCRPGVRVHDRVPRAHPPLLRASTASTPTITLSYGATEAKIPEIADAVVEITETGRALRAAGLQDPRHHPRLATPSSSPTRRAYADPDEAQGDGAAADAARRARSRRAAGCW